jgi:hypothetical protein
MSHWGYLMEMVIRIPAPLAVIPPDPADHRPATREPQCIPALSEAGNGDRRNQLSGFDAGTFRADAA